MTDASDTSPDAKPKRSLAWLGAVIPLLIIAASAGAYVLLFADSESPESTDTPAPQTLETGKDYYLAVRTIELYPTRPDGKAWDRIGINDDAPDIDFSLAWQGNTVFDAKQEANALVGSWDIVALDLKKAILSQQVDLAGSISAAIIHVQPGTEVILDVWDNDLTGKDTAGQVTLQLDQMQLGDNTYRFDQTQTSAIKRIVVRVIDKSLPVEELVNEAIQP